MRGSSSSLPKQSKASEGTHPLHYPAFQMLSMQILKPFKAWKFSQLRGNAYKFDFPPMLKECFFLSNFGLVYFEN